MGRKDFLKFTAKLGIALCGLFALPFLFSLRPARIKEKNIHYFFLSSIEEMPKRDVKRFELILDQRNSGAEGLQVRKMNIYIVRRPDGWIALSPVCTHLGCMVNYSRIKREFICPCHGGRYSIDGKVIAGPPPMPLPRLPLRVEDDRVFVGIKV